MLFQRDTTRRPGFWKDVPDDHRRLQATGDKIALGLKARSAEALRSKYHKMINEYWLSNAVEMADELDDEAEQ